METDSIVKIVINIITLIATIGTIYNAIREGGDAWFHMILVFFLVVVNIIIWY